VSGHVPCITENQLLWDSMTEHRLRRHTATITETLLVKERANTGTLTYDRSPFLTVPFKFICKKLSGLPFYCSRLVVVRTPLKMASYNIRVTNPISLCCNTVHSSISLKKGPNFDTLSNRLPLYSLKAKRAWQNTQSRQWR
jgi:hypothetical protein